MLSFYKASCIFFNNDRFARNQSFVAGYTLNFCIAIQVAGTKMIIAVGILQSVLKAE
ncbi:hypothetical protein GO684_03270 [Wolbachia endosymbiont of Litomosoides brasiliensis]|uniref:hypothetical protein n=1 Tax=Wolbachia endosymbiont of Litomosoides brasiliensis TaxID=1812117 RepID=UPI00158DDB32|nr:hypothetical protein [Wolbachia endosymbiont of Litomosoides brasiliensis]NUY39673.1 hypothetical protein [Wolbachia endosymbiont of Litomosoides brasiliensis]